MADPQVTRLTQLRNIQSKTGKTIADLHAVLAASGLGKTADRRALLIERYQLGYGDANTVALFYGRPLPTLDTGPAPPAVSSATSDALDGIYSGAKAALRPLHDAVPAFVHSLGEFDQAPKKTYLSLRRKRQFAMVGPATKDAIEIGLNAKNSPMHARLKSQPPGSMCQATTRIASASEFDATLKGWIKQAYDAAR